MSNMSGKQKLLIEKLVPKKHLAPEYQKEREDYHQYCQTVHRGKWKSAKHLRYICRKLDLVEQGKIRRLILFLPPRHSKSQTTTETFPSYALGKKPDRRIITLSYSGTFAEKFGRLNRQKVEEFGDKIFGISLSHEQSSKTNWTLDGQTGGMISVGIGGSVTGEGADIAIVDDPIKNRQEAESETYRERVWSEWQDTIQTRLHPGAAVIVIMTPWHEDDFGQRLVRESHAILAEMIIQAAEENFRQDIIDLAENPDFIAKMFELAPHDDFIQNIIDEAKENDVLWDIVRLPCIAEDEDDLLGRKPGEALWPEHGYDEKWAARKEKAVGPRTWSALYQQRPSPAEGNIIKRAWWKEYTVLPDKFDRVFQSWDLTFKDTKNSDFVVGQVWGQKGSALYLLDQVRDRMGLSKTIIAMINMHNKWPQTRAVLVEDKANGSGIIDLLKSKISGIIPITPTSSKEARCWEASVDVEAGNVFIPSKDLHPWVNGFIEEFAAFPNGKNDDQVDTATQAINWARTKRRKRMIISEEILNRFY